MNPKQIVLTAAFAALSVTALRAGTVTPGDAITGGIGYRWTVSLGETDSATASRHVGAWSWEDQSLFAVGVDDPVGWTHTSDWVALTLTQATTFTLRLERDANVSQPISGDPLHLADTESLYPSFTIWSNWDNDLAPQAFADANNGGVPTNDWHTWNNDGAVAWAEDLTYVGHVSNSVATSAEATYTLPAGQYTIAIGSNAAATDPDRQGYRATFTAVPEPGTAAMLLAGLGVLAARRRRARGTV